MICLVNKTQIISCEAECIQHSSQLGTVTTMVLIEWIDLEYSMIIAGANSKRMCGSSSVASGKLSCLFLPSYLIQEGNWTLEETILILDC